MNNYIVFDFETTGLSPKSCDVIQISAIMFKDGEKIPFNRFLQIDYPVPEQAAAVHGITNDLLDKEAVSQEEAWHEFALFLGDDMRLIGHNIVNFDVLFLEENFKKWGLELPKKSRYFDTAMVYKAKKLGLTGNPGESHYAFCKRIGGTFAKGVYFRLTLCCEEMGIDISQFQAHRADGDVEMTDLIFQKHLASHGLGRESDGNHR